MGAGNFNTSEYAGELSPEQYIEIAEKYRDVAEKYTKVAKCYAELSEYCGKIVDIIDEHTKRWKDENLI